MIRFLFHAILACVLALILGFFTLALTGSLVWTFVVTGATGIFTYLEYLQHGRK